MASKQQKEAVWKEAVKLWIRQLAIKKNLIKDEEDIRNIF